MLETYMGLGNTFINFESTCEDILRMSVFYLLCIHKLLLPFHIFCLFCLLLSLFLAIPHSLWDLSFPTKDWAWALSMNMWSPNHWTVRGRSTFRDPICCIFFLCVPVLKDSLFLISPWNTGRRRAAQGSQDWDHGKEHLLRFPSVTPFSDSLQRPCTQ